MARLRGGLGTIFCGVTLAVLGALFVPGVAAQQPAARQDKVFAGDARCTRCHNEEKFRFSDIALDNYQYTIGTGTSTSHLSGAYAFPNYTLNVAYVAGTYKF
jgi:hypothetical protein